MSQEEIAHFVMTNLKGKRPTDVVREHLKKLENLANCFLRQMNSIKPQNQVVYNCESFKCPFRLCFSKIGKQNLYLSSYQLVHDHVAEKSSDHDHKCLIRLISEFSEKIYEDHFLAEINKEENKIIFKRPCLIVDALKKDHGFDFNALTEDAHQRVKLKKKLDNIIYVLRRNFRKEFPQMICIEDEFVGLRAAKRLTKCLVKITSPHQRKLSIASSVNSYDSQMFSSSPTAASSAEVVRSFIHSEQQSYSQEPFSSQDASYGSFSLAIPCQLNNSNNFESSSAIFDQVSQDNSQSDSIELPNQPSQNSCSSSNQSNTSSEEPKSYFEWLLSNRHF